MHSLAKSSNQKSIPNRIFDLVRLQSCVLFLFPRARGFKSLRPVRRAKPVIWLSKDLIEEITGVATTTKPPEEDKDDLKDHLVREKNRLLADGTIPPSNLHV